MSGDFVTLVRAFGAQGATFLELVDATPDLDAPTALGDWTCGVLVGHVTTAIEALWRWQGEAPAGVIEVDRVMWWSGVDPATNDDFSQRYAAKRTHDDLRSGIADAVGRANGLLAAASPDTVLVAPGGIASTRLDEAVATRIFELVVHGIDLSTAIGESAVPDHEALAVAADILDRRLGSERPYDLAGDLEWVRAATGRAAHPDGRLPVVS